MRSLLTTRLVAVQLPTPICVAGSDQLRKMPNKSLDDVAPEEYRLRVGEREWSILHTGALISVADEQAFLSEPKESRLPYGVALWPASIALAHELAVRANQLCGVRLLELGA